ncbi:MAG: CRISPR-associated endonuclease Cas6 [candidate division KSB1 bacterium]|nr:CRISPR-associated endonuclease Cas6 [candidate division KSB1 bacterium]
MVKPIIPYLRWELIPESPGDYKAHHLRGAMAGLYRDWWVFHQHFGRQYLYRHPLVQYKSLNGVLMVVGLGIGAELLAALEPPPALQLGRALVKFREIRKIAEEYIPDFVTRHQFNFATPWLALNEDNHAEYREHVLHERKENIQHQLQQILKGNILSFAKGIGLTVESQLQAAIRNWNAQPMPAKQRNSGWLMGFAASGEITFAAPPFWGFGKQSSRGNGVMVTRKIEEEGERL